MQYFIPDPIVRLQITNIAKIFFQELPIFACAFIYSRVMELEVFELLIKIEIVLNQLVSLPYLQQNLRLILVILLTRALSHART